MEFKDFCQEVKEKLRNTLSDDYGIIIRKVRKNNGVFLTALSITRKDINIAPNVYIDIFYEEYKKGRLTLDDITDNIYAMAMGRLGEALGLERIPRNIDDFNQIKNDIVIKVINYEWNKKALKDIPHIKWNDLAITYCYRLKINNNYDELGLKLDGNIQIDNRLLEIWNISKEELHSVAMDNTRKFYMPEITVITKVLEAFLTDNFDAMNPPEYDKDAVENMFVFTNKEKFLGASSFLFPELIQKANEEMWDCEIVYIIPSSINELILMPYMSNSKPDMADVLRGMIKDVNDSEFLERIEILSYSLYKWERDTNEITIAQEEKEMEIIYSRNQEELLHKKNLPSAVENRIWKNVDILNECYGSERRIMEGDGGFVVLVENEVETEVIDRAFNISSQPSEYTEEIFTDTENFIERMFLLSSDYAVVVFCRKELAEERR